MSTTLRDATESTVHAITDRVGDALHHVDLPHFDLPHFDLPHFGRRRARRWGGPLMVGAVVVLAVLAVLTVVRRSGAAGGNGHGDVAMHAPSRSRTPADAAA